MSSSNGAPQPSQTGPSRNWMRLQAAAESPPASAEPPSMAWGGETRANVPRHSARARGPGFNTDRKRPSSALMPPPLLFDRALHRKRLDRAASGFAAADFLQRRAALDLVERLEGIMRDFPRGVDLSARTGALRNALAESPAAERVGLLVESALSSLMLAARTGPRLVLDEERLPFAPPSLDLIVLTLG